MANGPNGRSRTGTKHSMRERGTDSTAEMPERPGKTGGGTADGPGFECQARAACGGNAGDGTPKLMEEVLRRENIMTAYKRVVRNAGAPGVDGMTVTQLMPHCRKHWAQTISMLRRMGLVSFLDELRRLARSS